MRKPARAIRPRLSRKRRSRYNKPMTALLRIGTRGSPLALAQAYETRDRLAAAHADLAADGAIEIKIIRTTGDRIQQGPLSAVGGKGLFTKEIEEALLEKRIDIAVHSMKDVPTVLPNGLVVDCILPREDPRDALITQKAASFETLPEGALVGTASIRRQAILLNRRPDLRVTVFRGNVDTRLSKLAAGEVDATLLGAAGLNRLGRSDEATALLSPKIMLPAVGQGAVGVERRADDTATADRLRAIHDGPSGICVRAERALLETLDGSCRTPIGGLAELSGDTLRLRALIALPDGTEMLETEETGATNDAEAIGRRAGEVLLERAGPAFLETVRDHS